MTPQEMRAKIAAEANKEEGEVCCGTNPSEEDDGFESLDMDEFFEACEMLKNCQDMFKAVVRVGYLHPSMKYEITTLSDEIGQFIEGFVFSSDNEEQTVASKKKGD